MEAYPLITFLFGDEGGMSVAFFLAYLLPLIVVLVNLAVIVLHIIKRRKTWKNFLVFAVFYALLAFTQIMNSNEEGCVCWTAIALVNFTVSMIFSV